MSQEHDLIDKHHRILYDLKLSEDNLEEEISHLHHELRRVRDGIERVGGSSHALEQKVRQLLGNIKLCKSDLMENRKQQERLLEISSSMRNFPDGK